MRIKRMQLTKPVEIAVSQLISSVVRTYRRDGRPAMAYAMTLVVLLLGLIPSTATEAAAPPVFFAVSVEDLDASVKWYVETLDLTATRMPGTTQAKVALLQGQGLVVELVEHSEAFELTTRLPELQKRYLAHGLFKVGFFVADLDSTIERLKQRGAHFKGTAFTDKVLGAKSILLLDNSDNVIQLFERLAAK
jgi:predicted enzyme related to lactoylglutathione lyase